MNWLAWSKWFAYYISWKAHDLFFIFQILLNQMKQSVMNMCLIVLSFIGGFNYIKLIF